MARWTRWVARLAVRILDPGRASIAEPPRSSGRCRPNLEGLEGRELLSSLGSPPFAVIPGRIDQPGRAAQVDVRLEPGGFVADRTMPMLLAMQVEPAPGSTARPSLTHIVSLQGRNTYNSGTLRGPLATNVAVPNARPTTYGVGIRGLDRTTGDFVIKVSLPGDTNGDGVVDRTDIGRIRAAYGTSSGGRRFDAAADVNGDGTIGDVDIELARRNLGATASVVDITPRNPPARGSSGVRR